MKLLNYDKKGFKKREKYRKELDYLMGNYCHVNGSISLYPSLHEDEDANGFLSNARKTLENLYDMDD